MLCMILYIKLFLSFSLQCFADADGLYKQPVNRTCIILTDCVQDSNHHLTVFGASDLSIIYFDVKPKKIQLYFKSCF